MIRLTNEQFEEIKRLQEPEVFTEAQMNAWVEGLKDTLTKAEVDELDEVEKAVVDEFNHEFTSFVKVQVISTPSESELSKGLKYDIFFIREKQVEWIEKGGRPAVIGEIRSFGGRDYIKTNQGWKFHGKGTGAKARTASDEEVHGKEQSKKKEDKTSHYEEVLTNRGFSKEQIDTMSYDDKEFGVKNRLKPHHYTGHLKEKSLDIDIEKSEDGGRFGIYLDTKLNREMNRVGLVFGEKIEKSEEDELEKGGEGSRGGKIIGHTKSGKPIYDTANHPSHKEFTPQEHKEAYHLHRDASKEAHRGWQAVQNKKDATSEEKESGVQHWQDYLKHSGAEQHHAKQFKKKSGIKSSHNLSLED